MRTDKEDTKRGYQSVVAYAGEMVNSRRMGSAPMTSGGRKAEILHSERWQDSRNGVASALVRRRTNLNSETTSVYVIPKEQVFTI